MPLMGGFLGWVGGGASGLGRGARWRVAGFSWEPPEIADGAPPGGRGGLHEGLAPPTPPQPVRHAAAWGRALTISVWKEPGGSELTRMCRGPSSGARARVNPSSAALVAL